MTIARKRVGRSGEERAAAVLAKRGYRILERNYRLSCGEIDIIALHRGEIVFVEVKARTSSAFGAPELAVTPRKQERMAKAALGYLKAKKLHQLPCRFDVVAIHGGDGNEVEVIEHAFAIDPSRM